MPISVGAAVHLGQCQLVQEDLHRLLSRSMLLVK
jgi:hypothetical protein